MIVRISTEGQYRLPDEDADRLNDLDNDGRRGGRGRRRGRASTSSSRQMLALVRSDGHAARRRRARGVRRDPPAAGPLVRRGPAGVHRRGPDPGLAMPGPPAPLDRDAPEREPALELGLDGQLGADLGLEAQLALGVALLLAAARARTGRRRRACSCRSSRRACRARRGRRTRRTARGRRSRRPASALRDRVDADHEVLEVGVAQDHPAVAELVVGASRPSCRSPRRCPRTTSSMSATIAVEVGGRRAAGRRSPPCRAVLSPSSVSSVDVRRRHREQPVGAGLLSLRLPGRTSKKPMGSAGYARALQLRLEPLQRRDPLLHRRVRREQAADRALAAPGGKM